MNIAHEIRTPLASIRGAVQELTRHSLTDPADQRLSEIVRRESDRVDRILQEFLDFARMRPSLRRSLDVQQLAEETLVLLRQRPEAQSMTIECEGVGPYVVDADPDQLKQALVNVTTNALEAVGPEGQIRIRFQVVDLPEKVEGQLGSRRGVEILVEDDGDSPVGEAEASKIFLPFYTTKKGGLGLGLALTQKIMRLHEGDVISGPSELGGTCIRLRLPLSPQAEGEQEARS